jgi:hypothetical protein
MVSVSLGPRPRATVWNMWWHYDGLYILFDQVTNWQWLAITNSVCSGYIYQMLTWYGANWSSHLRGSPHQPIKFWLIYQQSWVEIAACRYICTFYNWWQSVSVGSTQSEAFKVDGNIPGMIRRYELFKVHHQLGYTLPWLIYHSEVYFNWKIISNLNYGFSKLFSKQSNIMLD